MTLTVTTIGLATAGIWMLRKGSDNFQRAVGLVVITIGLCCGIYTVVFAVSFSGSTVEVIEVVKETVIVPPFADYHPDEYRRLPNPDLSNIKEHELSLICELVENLHFSMDSMTELYFDERGNLMWDVNTGRTRDTWPYREALRQKCPGVP